MTSKQDDANSQPGEVRSMEGLGLLPEQAGWAVLMHGTAVLFANNSEKARGMSAGATTPVFTDEQMRAYAAEQVAAEREQCAKLCEAQQRDGEYQYRNACQDCADAIRGA